MALSRARKRLEGWGALLAGLGGIAGGGGLLLFTWAPELRAFALATLAAGAALLALAAVAALPALTRAATGRRGRLSGVSLASVAAAAAAVVAVNVIASAADVRWDLTATRQFELAPQTEQALAALDADLRVTGFAAGSDDGDLRFEAAAEGFLERFARLSGGRLTWRFVDPQLEPSAALELGVTEWPSLLFESDATGLREAVGPGAVTEQRLLTATLRVTQTRSHKGVRPARARGAQRQRPAGVRLRHRVRRGGTARGRRRRRGARPRRRGPRAGGCVAPHRGGAGCAARA